jgi:hypothetical protein
MQQIQKACAQQLESSAVAHQANHDNGPFGQHTQQQTTKNDDRDLFIRAMATITLTN